MNEPIDSDGDGNNITMSDIFRDSINVEEITELRINSQKLYNYINSTLDSRERQIICMRYGLVRFHDGNVKVEKALTQQEVANYLGISRSYVSRIEKKALELLKDKFLYNELTFRSNLNKIK
jgi:RNA polymerase sporulation-specific sigma factor